MHLKET